METPYVKNFILIYVCTLTSGPVSSYDSYVNDNNKNAA